MHAPQNPSNVEWLDEYESSLITVAAGETPVPNVAPARDTSHACGASAVSCVTASAR
jgi:hypothetical protein